MALLPVMIFPVAAANATFLLTTRYVAQGTFSQVSIDSPAGQDPFGPLIDSFESAGFEVTHIEAFKANASPLSSGTVRYYWSTSDDSPHYVAVPSYTATSTTNGNQTAIYQPDVSSAFVNNSLFSTSYVWRFSSTEFVITIDVFEVSLSKPVTAIETILGVTFQQDDFYDSYTIDYPIIAPRVISDEQEIAGVLDEIYNGLFGSVDDPELDALESQAEEDKYLTESVTDVLGGYDTEIVLPSLEVVEGNENMASVLAFIFSFPFVLTIFTLAISLWVIKVILYGVG